MSQSSEIRYYNRAKKQVEVEKVYGDAFVKMLYGGGAMGKMLSPIFANKYLSKAYGFVQGTMLTQLKVPKFVKNFQIDLAEYEPGSVAVDNQALSYKNFNEFFIRKFKTGKRSFSPDQNEMSAFSEARYFGYDAVNDDVKIPVKGYYLNAIELLGDAELAADFMNGPLLLARLCPVDYHRYHYPDHGKTIKSYPVHGEFHSVNPLALKFKQDIFISNERRVSILETQNFGKLAYIEVGAVMVGKIVQSHDESKSFRRGQEKGYFLFGGSTVIVLGEPGLWTPSQDILSNTKNGMETYIQLGDVVATKN
jgi:phosphatidylserine decarboxylase